MQVNCTKAKHATFFCNAVTAIITIISFTSPLNELYRSHVLMSSFIEVFIVSKVKRVACYFI